jgi:hypothetical protein
LFLHFLNFFLNRSYTTLSGPGWPT